MGKHGLMREAPMVSVVIPTYNRKDMLKECLESLFNQTYPKDKYEIIVVNDGSTDGTEEVLKEYAKKAPCAFKWLTQQNKGSYAARNLGIKNARGEIICFIDDDCIADKRWLEELVRGFTDDGIGGVGGKIKAYSLKTSVEKYAKMDQESAIRNSFLITCNAAYRKDILEIVGYFDSYFRSGGDNDMGIRVTWKGYKLKYASNAIVYHEHRTTLSDLIKQRYNYGVGEAILSKKYGYSSIFMQFIIIKLLGLFYSVAALPIKLEKDMQILNIIVTSAYVLGMIKGILLDRYRVERWKSEQIRLEFLEEMKILRAFRKLRKKYRLRWLCICLRTV